MHEMLKCIFYMYFNSNQKKYGMISICKHIQCSQSTSRWLDVNKQIFLKNQCPQAYNYIYKENIIPNNMYNTLLLVSWRFYNKKICTMKKKDKHNIVNNIMMHNINWRKCSYLDIKNLLICKYFTISICRSLQIKMAGVVEIKLCQTTNWIINWN